MRLPRRCAPRNDGDGRQKTEDRGQRTEDRRQKTDDGKEYRTPTDTFGTSKEIRIMNASGPSALTD